MRDKNRHFQSVAWLLIFGGCLIGGKVPAQDIDQDAVNRVFQFGDLESDRVQANRQYLPFLNVDSLHCGIYCLKAGAKDGQQPHTQDEIYYVETGVAKIQIEGKNYDLKKGSIVFVPAKAKHHFHSIKQRFAS